MKNNKIKLLLWGILLSLSLVIFIINFKVSTKVNYFNKVYLPNNTTILNFTPYSYLDTIIKVGLNELEVSPKTIILRLLESTKQVGNIKFNAYIKGNKEFYVIYLKNSGRRDNIRTISHELIHLKEGYTKQMVLFKDFIVYRGILYKINEIPEYMDRPWEVSAFIYGDILERKIIKILYGSNKTSN